MLKKMYLWNEGGASECLDSGIIAGADSSPDADADSPLLALDEATALRRACLVPIGSVDINERESVAELQTRVHALMTWQSAYLLQRCGGCFQGKTDVLICLIYIHPWKSLSHQTNA